MTAIGTEIARPKFPQRFTVILLIWFVPALICATVPDWWFFAFWMFPVSLPWILTPFIALLLSLIRFLQKRYWAAARLLLFPILLVGLFSYLKFGADYVWFELHRPAYEKAIAQLTPNSCAATDTADTTILDCGPPMIVVFEFGGFLSMWHGVVYDQSDEFAKPPDSRSQAWKNSKATEWLACSAPDRVVGQHYYLASGSVGSCD